MLYLREKNIAKEGNHWCKGDKLEDERVKVLKSKFRTKRHHSFLVKVTHFAADTI